MRNQSTGSRWTAARDELRALRIRQAHRARPDETIDPTIERELATNVSPREISELRAVFGRYDTPEVDRMQTLIYRRNVA